MRTKLHTQSVLVWGILAVLFLVFQNVIAQQTSAVENSTSLQNLVGEKCTIVLKDGEPQSGTLWDYGEDYVTLKIKKGLLYSKAEKFKMSEIEYIETESGARVYSENVAVKAPKQLFFDISDINEDEAPQETESQASTDISKPGAMAEDNEYPISARPVKELQETVSPPQKSAEEQTVASEQTKTAVESSKLWDSQTKKSTASTATTKRTRVTVSPSGANPGSETGMPQDLQTAQVEAATEAGSKRATSKEIRILQYQKLILFGSALICVLLLLLFKTTGVKSKALARYSLFPAQLVKMDQKFGIIDQGADDGVKIDDIIRLYSKNGKKVEYKGKVQVRKVGANYSAVELVKANDNVKIKVGDVGYRERNRWVVLMKRLRIMVGAMLSALASIIQFAAGGLISGIKFLAGGLAKGIETTAKNIEIKEQEPPIDIDIEEEVLKGKDSSTSNRKTKAKVTKVDVQPKQKKSNKKKPQKTEVKPEDDSGIFGFGMEEK